MIQAYTQQIALVLAGMALGWTALFCFVVAPVSFKDMDYGRADRHVRRIIKAGHGALSALLGSMKTLGWLAPLSTAGQPHSVSHTGFICGTHDVGAPASTPPGRS